MQETEDGLFLKEKPAFNPTKLDEVAGCLPYSGPPNSLDEMEDGIRKGARAQFQRKSRDR